MDTASREETTRLLASISDAESYDLDRLVPHIYEELRGMAHRQLVRERREHTLQTTALVHEAYLRLVDDSKVGRRGKSYFFASAAHAMRRILVDYARRRNAVKRGEGNRAEDVEDVQVAVDAFATDLLDLDTALSALADTNERAARVVECKHFADMTFEEIAAALGASVRTVKYDWSMARAWLYDYLKR